MFNVSMVGNIANEYSTPREGYISFRVGCFNEAAKDTTWVSVLYHYQTTRVLEFLTKGTLVFVSGNATLKVFDGKVDVNVYADTLSILHRPKG